MTAQDLKNAILQLAVQGKLVPQAPTEAEADIRGIKQKPTEELDFDIPQTWKTAHIECVSNIIPSKQFQILESEVCKTGRFPVISQSKEYTIGFSDVADRVFHHDEPVIAFGDHTTEVKYITFDFVIGADGVKLFAPNTDVVFPPFLYYTLQYYTIGLNKVGGYSRHYKFIKNKPIPLPPLAEQERIVAKIEELMPLVEEYGKAEERLTALNAEFPDKLRKSILQQAIQGKLTEREPADEPATELLKRIHAEKERLIKEGKIKKGKPLPPITEEEGPFEIPENWEWVCLDEIAQIKSSKRVFEKDYVPKGIPFFRSKEIGDLQRGEEIHTQLFISQDHYENLKKAVGVPAVGDILLTSVGTIGNTWICDGREFYYKDGNITQICYNGFFVPQYIELFIHSALFEQQARSTVAGTAYSALTIIKLKQIILPLPPLAEQQRIVDRVNELLTVCDELK